MIRMARDFASDVLPINPGPPAIYLKTDDLSTTRLSTWKDILAALDTVYAGCVYIPFRMGKSPQPGWAKVETRTGPAGQEGAIIVGIWPSGSAMDQIYGTKEAVGET